MSDIGIGLVPVSYLMISCDSRPGTQWHDSSMTLTMLVSRKDAVLVELVI